MKARDYFDQRAAGYEKNIRRNFFWRNLKSREQAWVWRLLSVQAGHEVLDAGSGPGIYAEFLKEKGCRLICFDSAMEMAGQVKAKNIPVFIADVQDLALRRKFDRILCLGVFEFMTCAEKALRNLAQALGPGGLIVLLVPLSRGPGFIYKLFHYFHGIKIELYTPDRIDFLLAKAGLESERQVTLLGFCRLIRARLKEEKNPC